MNLMSQEKLAISQIIKNIRTSTTYQQLQEVGINIKQNQTLDPIEITKKFEEILLVGVEYTLDLKVNVFEVMSSMLLGQAREKYLKHFATRIHGFLQKYSIQIVGNDDLCKRVIDAFKRWKEKRLFTDTFFKKLKDSAFTIFSSNTEEFEGSFFKKYTKKFLMDFRDINKADFSKMLYQSHKLKKEKQDDITDIRKAFYQIEHSVESQGENQQKIMALQSKLDVMLNSLMLSLKLNDEGMNKILEMLSLERTNFDEEWK